MAPISVSLEPDDPAVGVVTLVGEYDGYSAAHLERELTVLLDIGLRVIVDLSAATFVDSLTLSVLLRARRRAEARSLGFVLALPDDQHTEVHRILELTHLATAFAVRPTLPKALAAAREGAPAERQQVA